VRSRKREEGPQFYTSVGLAIATDALTIVTRRFGEADLIEQRIEGGVAILILCLGRGRDGVVP